MEQQPRTEEIHLLDYWRIVNTKRHIVISFFIIVVGVAAVYSFASTPLHRSTAKLLVSQENNTTLTFAEGTPQIQIKDPAEYYNTQKKILFSRTFVDRVVRRYALDANPYFVAKKKKASSGIFRSIRKFAADISAKPRVSQADNKLDTLEKEEVDPWLTSQLLSNMRVDVSRDSSIMEIHFTSENPRIAASVANAIAETYIEYNLDLRLTPYRNSVEWLTGRLTEIKGKVEESEKKLQKYKEQKGIISQEAKESILTQKLEGLVAELVKVQGSRQEAEAKYTQIKDVVDRPELLATVPDIMNNQVIQSLRSDELNLKRQQSELSEKFGPKHPQIIKVNTELETVRKHLIGEARKMLNAAKTEYEIALNREKFLSRSVEEEKREVLDLSREMIAFKVVSEESENNRRFYEMLLKKLQEATLLSGVTISNIQIIDVAIPSGPFKPDRSKIIFLAAMLGLIGGVFLAIFTDYMDDSVKSQDDVELHLGQHFLGMVPAVQDKAVFSDLQSPVSESYRTIRMGLKFAASQRPLKTLLVTSAVPGEGKTTTACNLAVVLANMGEHVLLIDADLRRQSIHKQFNLDNSVGLGSVILNQADLHSTIRRVEGQPNLSVLSAGPTFPNPAEVLSSDRAREVITSLRGTYDLIIIDSPPVMPVSDPLILSELADAVLIITKGGETSRSVARKACQSLEQINARIVGVVLNNLRIPKGSYGSYYYSYYRAYGEVRKEIS